MVVDLTKSEDFVNSPFLDYLVKSINELIYLVCFKNLPIAKFYNYLDDIANFINWYRHLGYRLDLDLSKFENGDLHENDK